VRKKNSHTILKEINIKGCKLKRGVTFIWRIFGKFSDHSILNFIRVVDVLIKNEIK